MFSLYIVVRKNFCLWGRKKLSQKQQRLPATFGEILMPMTSASIFLQITRHSGEITVSLKANSSQITGCDVMNCANTWREWECFFLGGAGHAEIIVSVLYRSVDTPCDFRSLLVDAVRRVVSTHSVISHLRQAVLWGAEETHCSQCSWPETVMGEMSGIQWKCIIGNPAKSVWVGYLFVSYLHIGNLIRILIKSTGFIFTDVSWTL